MNYIILVIPVPAGQALPFAATNGDLRRAAAFQALGASLPAQLTPLLPRASFFLERARRTMPREEKRMAVQPIEALTPREGEVLALLGKGLTNREIGERLVISEKTVKSHVSEILGKLNVSNRTEAVITAQRCGLLAPAGVAG
jgi:DNA-binding NarL/FixJ family response regulator